jgi:ketosteroid isomerase-like protein
MKQVLAGAAFLIQISAVAPLLRAESAAALSIRKLLQTQVAAWNRGDVTAFMQGYWKSPNTEFVSSSGVQRGWQAVLDRYRQAYPDREAMGRLNFSHLEITTLCSDAALILGHWELQRRRDHLGGVFTLVARRLPEGWRIVSDHTSTVTSP